MSDRQLTCKVCGREFTPYSSSRKVIKTMSGRHYDTFDCPRCGCQVVAQERIVEGQDDIWEHKLPQRPSANVYPDLMDIIYDNLEDARKIVQWLNEILDRYGAVTVTDYYDLTGIKDAVPYMAYKYGWENLDDVSIMTKHNGGYVLHMPPAKKLDQKE